MFETLELLEAVRLQPQHLDARELLEDFRVEPSEPLLVEIPVRKSTSESSALLH